MDIFTNMFTKRTIVEENKKNVLVLSLLFMKQTSPK